MVVEPPDTQDKVVELLGAVRTLPNPVRNREESKTSSEKVFSDLGYFKTDIADFFRDISSSSYFLQILKFLAGLGGALRFSR